MHLDQSRETTRILRQIRERRDCGRVHAAIYEIAGEEVPEPNAVMEAAGLAPVAGVPLTREDALTATTEVLARDIAHRATIMPRDDAEALASSFLDCFPHPAQYFTNGELLVAQALGTSGAWEAATSATFDSGIVVVAPGRAGILWVEDED